MSFLGKWNYICQLSFKANYTGFCVVAVRGEQKHLKGQSRAVSQRNKTLLPDCGFVQKSSVDVKKVNVSRLAAGDRLADSQLD